MRIFIVNGAPGSGKTTFENFVAGYIDDWYSKGYTEVRDCLIFSTIDYVKEIATKCGWDGTKDDKSRKFLSDLKDLLTNFNDSPFQNIIKKVRDLPIYMYHDSTLIFIDCREPKEIKRLCSELDAQSLLIRRPGLEIQASNHADAEVENYTYDIIIENDGSLCELRDKAYEFLKNI